MGMHGSWLWYELMTRDADAAMRFYGPLLGWRAQPIDGGYVLITNADGGMTGGLLPLTETMAANGAVPAWLGYIGVDDVDAFVARAAADGASVLMPPADVAMAGRIALIADPCGAPVYVMTPNGEGTSTAFGLTQPGRCAWNELCVGDPARALAFFTAHFGWDAPPPMDMGPMGQYHFIAHEGVSNGGVVALSEGMGAPHWNHYFRVADIDRAAVQVGELGGRVVNGPHPIAGGDAIIHLFDPEGAFACLVGARAA